jgi:acetoin utilization deacetylase AcuC-like enzyme
VLTVFSPKCSLSADKWISLSKPQQVINGCWATSLDLVEPEPLTREQALLVHTKEYVDKVFAGVSNGFFEPSQEILDQVLHANGAMVVAAELAVRQKRPVFAPVSGFHHAKPNAGGGFCTFNGLVLALAHVHRLGLVRRAVILDFDGHFGDGTEACLYSKKMSWVHHMTREQPFKEAEFATNQAVTAISSRPDLVLYQAGADSWEGDSFGVGYFTEAQWLERDRRIFEAAKQYGVPIVWNLAGGYSGAKTIRLHCATFEIACRTFEPGRQNDVPAQVSILG